MTISVGQILTCCIYLTCSISFVVSELVGLYVSVVGSIRFFYEMFFVTLFCFAPSVMQCRVSFLLLWVDK